MEGDINMPDQKGTFSYTFPNHKSSDSFLTFVQENFPHNLAQHPKLHVGGTDFLQVLVTRTGSLQYDLVLRKDLDEKARELGGIRTP